jgi:hypothetical protein
MEAGEASSQSVLHPWSTFAAPRILPFACSVCGLRSRLLVYPIRPSDATVATQLAGWCMLLALARHRAEPAAARTGICAVVRRSIRDRFRVLSTERRHEGRVLLSGSMECREQSSQRNKESERLYKREFRALERMRQAESLFLVRATDARHVHPNPNPQVHTCEEKLSRLRVGLRSKQNWLDVPTAPSVVDALVTFECGCTAGCVAHTRSVQLTYVGAATRVTCGAAGAYRGALAGAPAATRRDEAGPARLQYLAHVAPAERHPQRRRQTLVAHAAGDAPASYGASGVVRTAVPTQLCGASRVAFVAALCKRAPTCASQPTRPMSGDTEAQHVSSAGQQPDLCFTRLSLPSPKQQKQIVSVSMVASKSSSEPAQRASCGVGAQVSAAAAIVRGGEHSQALVVHLLHHTSCHAPHTPAARRQPRGGALHAHTPSSCVYIFTVHVGTRGSKITQEPRAWAPPSLQPAACPAPG